MTAIDPKEELLRLVESAPDHGVHERTRCAACGGGSHRLVAELSYDSPAMREFCRLPGTGERFFLRPLMARFPYKLVECRGCGLVWQPYVLSDELERQVYGLDETPYEDGIRTWKWPESWRKYRYYAGQVERASAIFYLLNPKPPEAIEVLDFGAGWGSFALAAQALGHRVSAAELNPLKRRRLTSLGVSCVELPVDRRFDFIYSDQVFEHLSDPAAMLGLLTAHLAADGYLMLAVPALRRRGLEAALERGDLGTILRHYPFLHVNMFGGRALEALGRRLGLEPVAARAPLSARLDRLAPRRRLGPRLKRLGRGVARRLLFGSEMLFDGVRTFRRSGSSGAAASGSAST